MCLLSLTVLNSAAPVFVSVGFDPVDTPLQELMNELELMMAVLLLLPPLLWLYHLYRSFSFRGQSPKSTGDDNDDDDDDDNGKTDLRQQILQLQEQLAILQNEKRAAEAGK